ncbi:MAG TPA: flavin reductase family protein [Acidimicrobiales bacterium]|jgi:flavin reductase (DIM6/NTAB) family NADH-FMN oxidoreductase RutF
MSNPFDPEWTASFDSARFRQVLGHFPTGVTVVTAMSTDGPIGLSIGSFSSLSLDPPLVLFCAGRTSTTWPRIRDVGAFCVNILAEDQEDICRVFAGRGTDKFAGIGWRPSLVGAPQLHGCLASLDCRVDEVHEGGDHDIVIGRVLDLELHRQGGPLVFFRGGYGRFAP